MTDFTVTKGKIFNFLKLMFTNRLDESLGQMLQDYNKPGRKKKRDTIIKFFKKMANIENDEDKKRD